MKVLVGVGMTPLWIVSNALGFIASLYLQPLFFVLCTQDRRNAHAAKYLVQSIPVSLSSLSNTRKVFFLACLMRRFI